MSDDNLSGKDSLGEAANRYVTFQIVSSIIGGIVFLIFLFAFILPAFNHSNQSSGFSSSGPQVMPMNSGGPGTETVTIDGRPATPAEKTLFNQQINKAPSSQPSSQSPASSPR